MATDDSFLPPFLPDARADPIGNLIGRLSAHRTTSVAGRRCHRCGRVIEYAGCVKPHIPYVWCVECWSPRETRRDPTDNPMGKL